jgi:mycothiol synthase
MSVEFRPLLPGDLEALRTVVAHPSLAYEFDTLLEPEVLADKLADPFVDPACTWLGSVDGEPAGFSFAFVLPEPAGNAWAMLRIGVAEPFRRRGLGTALLETMLARLRARSITDGLRELCMSAWLPSDAALAFAARHGFHPARTFWRMERALDPVPSVAWPPGIEARTFAGGDTELADWNEVYNRSFAEHYHFVPSTVEHCRTLAAGGTFLPSGLVLTYRGGACVGFCRNEPAGRTGVVGVLGVVPEARGIGLGRALLRWAVAYFAGKDFERASLIVEGQNESALRLYLSEGFAITRTRETWARPL